MKKKLWLIWLIIFGFLTFIDQISKIWARKYLIPFEEQVFISKIINWHLTFNTGAAFSFLSEHTELLTIISFLAILILINYTRQIINKNQSLINLIAIGFITAGTTGNFIDRFYFKKVTDFIELKFLPIDFAIFNFADIFINLGAGVLIFYLFSQKSKTN